MGEQLIGRPTSQRGGFSTLRGASSPFAPNLDMFRGFTTPEPAPSPVSPAAPRPTLGPRPSLPLRREDWEEQLPGLFRSPMFANIRDGLWSQMSTLPATATVPASPGVLGGGFKGVPGLGPKILRSRRG